LNKRSANKEQRAARDRNDPAGSPSIPSMRLTAFVITTTHSAVTSGAICDDNTTVSVWNRLNGIRKIEHRDAEQRSKLAASTWPATFAGGETSMRSSSAPIDEHHARAEDQPNGSELCWNISWNCCIATRRPSAAGTDEHRGAAERRRRLRVHVPGVRRRLDTAPNRIARTNAAAAVSSRSSKGDDATRTSNPSWPLPLRDQPRVRGELGAGRLACRAPRAPLRRRRRAAPRR
jgi:hypothetical protein